MVVKHTVEGPPSSLRILVPLDDSFQAQRVLLYVRALAAATRGQLKLIRATDVEDETSFNSLALNAERLRDAGLRVEWSVESGLDAETAIQSAAIAWQPDLIALASTKSSGLDRWLNGSVSENVVKFARVPVLVVPPGWERPLNARQRVRILIPLDGSSTAEEAAWFAVRLASQTPTEIVMLRAVHDKAATRAAEDYVRQFSAKVQSALPDSSVSWRIVADSPVNAILEAASNLDVDAITMSTGGQTAPHLRIFGSTATDVFDNASVPLVLLGPRLRVVHNSAQMAIGAAVRTVDTQLFGEVHRAVVDVEQGAIVAIVVLGRGGLARDILVPIDFIESLAEGEVQLRITRDELAELPDFAYNEPFAPPPPWTPPVASLNGPELVPVRQHKRLGPTQRDVTRRTGVLATDGEIGHVERLEFDPETGHLIAFWARREGVHSRTLRIPAEWVQYAQEQDDSLRVPARRADIEAYLGYDR